MYRRVIIPSSADRCVSSRRGGGHDLHGFQDAAPGISVPRQRLQRECKSGKIEKKIIAINIAGAKGKLSKENPVKRALLTLDNLFP